MGNVLVSGLGASDRQSAVHDDTFAVGVAGRVRRQIQDSAGHLARFGVTPQRNLLDPVVVGVLVIEEGAGELGLGQPRQQGVDPNPQGAAFLGEGLGHVDDRGLGDRVDALFVARLQAVDRGDVDDRPAALPLHYFAGRHRHEEIAADVDLDGLVVGDEIRIENVAVVGIGRRVVDQDVQAAIGLFDMVESGGNVLHPAHVAGQGIGLAAGRADLVGDNLAVVQLAAGDYDMGTAGSQKLGDRLADAAAGAGDQRNFSGEVEWISLGHDGHYSSIDK